MVVEGLKPVPQFSAPLDFGNMWHVCEEELARVPSADRVVESVQDFGEWGRTVWEEPLKKYAQKLCRTYRTQQAIVNTWWGMARVMFPRYVRYWRDHPDVRDRVPMFQEQVFRVPYELPSGRTILLRGKFDSVDLVGKGSDVGVYLQENKTKSDPRDSKIARQLSYDLQTMMYLVALRSADLGDESPGHAMWNRYVGKIRGVRYNVVRRPRQYQGKKETHQQFLERLGGIIDDDPSEFYARWKVEVTDADVEGFQKGCLDPILENLCWWWEEVTGVNHEYPPPPAHWRHPFGVYNVMDEGGASDLDEYLATGSTAGLVRVGEMFPELNPNS
jgi:hypothetical protein